MLPGYGEICTTSPEGEELVIIAPILCRMSIRKDGAKITIYVKTTVLTKGSTNVKGFEDILVFLTMSGPSLAIDTRSKSCITRQTAD